MEHCRICAKDFATRRNLLKHNRKVHKIFVGRPKNNCSTPSLYECSECPSVNFSTKKELIRHIRVHTRQSEGGRRLMCPECDEIAQHYVDLRSHITEIHNIELTTEEITFNNAEDFMIWKHDIEENQPSSYVLNCGRKRMLDGSISEYYICHRSYGFRSSRTSNSTERKRRLKSSGSNKIGKACPAGFSVKKYVDGRIIVKICSTHMGHGQSLGDIFLNQEDRDQIAGKLHEGVEVERILDDIRDSAVVGHLKRIHLLERKDILNIKQNLGCVARRHEDDATNVDLCKHIHAVKHSQGSAIQIDENTTANEDNIVQETVQFLPMDHDENERNKQRVQALLEKIMGSIAVQNCTDEQYKLLEKKLQSCCTVMNSGDGEKVAHTKFTVKEKINSRKKVSPQKRFKSSTKPRKTFQFLSVSLLEATETKKCLSGAEGLIIAYSSSPLDHNYDKS